MQSNLEDSAVISGGEPGSHSIQGIGAGFIKNLDLSVIDQVLPISNTSAFQYSKILVKHEGIAGGISGAKLVQHRNHEKMQKSCYNIPIQDIYQHNYLNFKMVNLDQKA